MMMMEKTHLVINLMERMDLMRMEGQMEIILKDALIKAIRSAKNATSSPY
jgi:hypothetical protein